MRDNSEREDVFKGERQGEREKERNGKRTERKKTDVPGCFQTQTDTQTDRARH